MQMPPEALPQPGVPEGAPAPDMGPVSSLPQPGPQAVPDPSQQPQVPGQDDDTEEYTTRDRLAVELMLAAEKMAKAAGVAQAGDDADKAGKYAAAALDYTKAHVLLSPLEAADDLAQNNTQQP